MTPYPTHLPLPYLTGNLTLPRLTDPLSPTPTLTYPYTLPHLTYPYPYPHLPLPYPTLLPQLAHHFEVKIYFLRREPFLAALSYGKEKLVAQARGDRREVGGR